ncbi:hypothetical protein UUU_16450 [Klebsiella pneumoniae subsp. pneumoniae DSM 30104 = JCM 1662 = NBRC 14940]|nr:hypothetical protein HMPREF9538_02031 [Klebsiella sp. MS 92-3]EJK91620.1 hypothetical protein UUU_16450 [Klebsiella pneumoniae subsp. pneumoniae DSM 30104 = JCM 1662 = NBRC 14940]ESB03059.1 hypothetical protein HMPREF1619_00708 [Klebsiella pneumoniae 909957]KXA22046.1 hypothetical protein HMPREF3197_04321 [Klebsiella pneumoniae]
MLEQALRDIATVTARTTAAIFLLVEVIIFFLLNNLFMDYSAPLSIA